MFTKTLTFILTIALSASTLAQTPTQALASLVTSTAFLSINPYNTNNGTDIYKQYGCRSTFGSWPAISSWVSFDVLFSLNIPHMSASCSQFNVPNNSPDEIGAIWDGITAASDMTGVDARFILAVVMQESGGCVRAPTSNYGVRNPGLMQCHDGQATCNSDVTGVVQTPCPANTIAQMISEGVVGTAAGDGLAQTLNRATGPTYGLQCAMAFYGAARLYNSGSIDASGCFEKGIATHCYTSDIANRLTGWASAAHSCTFDNKA